MNEIDNHYYESLNDVGKAFYDWERQFINLGCYTSDIDLINGTPPSSIDAISNVSKLVHEYIHFLQNFATTWGAPVFTDFALNYLKIGASSASSEEHYRLPFSLKRVQNQMLKDGLVGREAVLSKLRSGNTITIDKTATVLPIELSFKHGTTEFFNGRVKTSFGMKMIREHMAHLGTQFFLNKTDVQIHHDHEELLKTARHNFRDQPEYWIAFEYIYQFGKFSSIGSGIFLLTQNALTVTKPVELVTDFFAWLSGRIDMIKPQTSFLAIVEDWLRDVKIALRQQQDLVKIVSHCTNIRDLCARHAEEHHLYEFVLSIADYAINNIVNTNGGAVLFHKNDPFSDFNYWRTKIATYGTGIIRYLDNVTIHGTEEHCNRMHDSFTFLLSCGIVMKKLLENSVGTCPFLFDIPVCRAEYRDNQGCYSNPFIVKNPDGSGKECLCRNGFLLLGMQDRMDFN